MNGGVCLFCSQFIHEKPHTACGWMIAITAAAIMLFLFIGPPLLIALTFALLNR